MKIISIAIAALNHLTKFLLYLNGQFKNWQRQHCPHRHRRCDRVANGAWSGADVTICTDCGLEISRIED